MTVERLETITDAELLNIVKTCLNITGSHFDATIQYYIAEVEQYLSSAGVLREVIDSTLAVGCIARGVSDLWNYGNGDTQLSAYFYERAEHLRFVKVKEGEADG